jgi:virulence-associated protein VagC
VAQRTKGGGVMANFTLADLRFGATHLLIIVRGRLVCVMPCRTTLDEVAAVVGHDRWRAAFRGPQ